MTRAVEASEIMVVLIFRVQWIFVLERERENTINITIITHWFTHRVQGTCEVGESAVSTITSKQSGKLL